jgi:hypothetical protein
MMKHPTVADTLRPPAATLYFGRHHPEKDGGGTPFRPFFVASILALPEADRVRIIFRSYLKLGSLNLLMAELRKRCIVTKFAS